MTDRKNQERSGILSEGVNETFVCRYLACSHGRRSVGFSAEIAHALASVAKKHVSLWTAYRIVTYWGQPPC